MALTTDELKTQGELLAKFLVAGRGVVANSLAKFKINDPTIGDKGFTPEYFQQEINAKYKDLTGIDILAGSSPTLLPADTLALLKTLLDESKKVCEENQALINMKDVAFKGFIPASYGRMVADNFKQKSGIAIKQTTELFRNTYNEPDAFEKGKLSEMVDPAYPKGQIVAQQDGNLYREMIPVYIKKACLGCHGDPKGALDVAGRKKEGYKEGELRGAISVAIPAD